MGSGRYGFRSLALADIALHNDVFPSLLLSVSVPFPPFFIFWKNESRARTLHLFSSCLSFGASVLYNCFKFRITLALYLPYPLIEEGIASLWLETGLHTYPQSIEGKTSVLTVQDSPPLGSRFIG